MKMLASTTVKALQTSISKELKVSDKDVRMIMDSNKHEELNNNRKHIGSYSVEGKLALQVHLRGNGGAAKATKKDVPKAKAFKIQAKMAEAKENIRTSAAQVGESVRQIDFVRRLETSMTEFMTSIDVDTQGTFEKLLQKLDVATLEQICEIVNHGGNTDLKIAKFAPLMWGSDMARTMEIQKAMASIEESAVSVVMYAMSKAAEVNTKFNLGEFGKLVMAVKHQQIGASRASSSASGAQGSMLQQSESMGADVELAMAMASNRIG